MWTTPSVKTNVNIFNFNIWKGWEIVQGWEEKKGPVTLFKKIALITMFSQSSRRRLCWIIQYLFLFGCPLFPRRVISCFKKELGSGGLRCHPLLQRQRRASGSPLLSNSGLCGLSPQQDKVKGNWPAWSFCKEGGHAHPFIFSQRPWSRSTNKILSASSLGLWSPLE